MPKTPAADFTSFHERSRRLYLIVALLSCALYLLLSVFPIQSSDLFLYLAIGRRFLAEGRFPETDPYLYTLPNFRWDILHEWGSYLASYGLYRIGGWPAIILAKAFLILLIPVTVIGFAWRRGYRSALTIGLLLLAALAGSYRFIERTSVISDVFVTITLAIVLLEIRNPGKAKYFLPPIFLVWVNLHPGFVTGLALCGLALLARTSQWREKQFRLFAGTIVLSGLACLANPSGISGALFPLTLSFGSGNEVFRKYYLEWLPTFDPTYKSTAEVGAFVALLLVTAAITVLRFLSRGPKPLFELGAFLFLAFTGSSAIRFVPMAAYGLVLLSVQQLADLEVAKVGVDESRVLTRRLTIAGIALCSLILVKISLLGYSTPAGPRKLGLGIDPRLTPLAAAEKLPELAPTGNIYNSHDFGAYLAWRFDGSRKLFWHGFATDFGFYDREYVGLQRSAEGFRQITEKYGITTLFLDRDEGRMDLFVQAVTGLGNWKLAYADANTFIVVRRP